MAGQGKANIRRINVLAGMTFNQYKAGTQAFVTRNQAIECVSQGITVKLTRQAQRYWKMIGQTGGRLELVKEPQPLLGEGQWQRKITDCLLDWWPLLMMLVML
ncbi:hypothetical protein Xentx_03197 [Xenorhabdus thuongxuanensis]|uniref:Uncharacterized protein n=1 Tax=Xenorhabdus thuongxuanensis TaxID=1873484 RepID=A0A1Q5TQD9_9GAMM|nr:hypothetical protein Xentx_03197 [Xenorhabdus thuongxuanensis]